MDRKKTEDFLVSVTKICETLIKQIPTKPEETLEFKLTKTRETISFKQSISIEGSWMVGLRSLEVYQSIFIITQETIKFIQILFAEISFAELKNELEEFIDLSDITPNYLQHDNRSSYYSSL